MSSVHDIHCHFVPARTREFLAHHDDVQIDDRGIRRGPAVLPLPAALSDATRFDAHVGALDAAVVAPPPALYLEGVAARDPKYAPEVNSALSEFTSDRAAATLAWLPLESPARALTEIVRVADDPTVVGVVIGTSLGGAAADPRLDPLWNALADAQLGVFLHPDSEPFQPNCRPLPNPSVIGFTAATATTALALLLEADGFWSSGARLCLSHGGGFLAPALDRVLRSAPGSAEQIRARLDQVWVDGLVFSEAMLALVVATFSAQRVLSGSDFPFPLSLSAAELVAQRGAGLSSEADPAQWCPRLSTLTSGVAS